MRPVSSDALKHQRLTLQSTGPHRKVLVQGASLMRDGFRGEQVVLELTGERGVLAPDPFSTMDACSFSSSRLWTRMALRAGSLQASARWLYQSTASSSSIRETMALCMSRVSADSSSMGSRYPTLDIFLLLWVSGLLGEIAWHHDHWRRRYATRSARYTRAGNTAAARSGLGFPRPKARSTPSSLLLCYA